MLIYVDNVKGSFHDSGKKKSGVTASVPNKYVFKIDKPEHPKDKVIRHRFIVTDEETEQLMFKMNPGEIELFDAANDKDGILGELATVIDSKVKGILMNRIRMGLKPIDFVEK